MRRMWELGAIPGVVGVSLWIVALWPGQMNPDSVLHWDEAISGNYSNWFPVSYSLLIKGSHALFGFTPAPIVALQSATLLLSVVSLVNQISQVAVVRNCLVGVFFLWPQVGFTATLIGKECLFLASFLALSSLILQARHKRLSFGTGLVFCLCVFASTILRWNGPIVVLGLLVTFVYATCRRVLALVVPAGISFLVGLLILLIPPVGNNLGAKSLRSGGQALDIAWSLSQDSSRFSQKELKTLAQVAPIQDWIDSQSNCDDAAMPLLYNVFTEGSDSWSTLIENRDQLRKIWIRDVLSNPRGFLEGRICKVRGLLIPAKEWWPAYSSPSQNVFEFRYGTTPISSKSERLSRLASQVLDAWGGSRIGILFAMPMIWLTCLVAWQSRQKNDRPEFLVVMALGGLVVISVFIGGVGLEPRYVFPSTTLFFLVASAKMGDEFVRRIRAGTGTRLPISTKS